MKSDEREFLRLCIAGADANKDNPNQPAYPFARDIGEKIGMSSKRIYYILNKWSWWDSGVNDGVGWFSDIEAARKALNEEMVND